MLATEPGREEGGGQHAERVRGDGGQSEYAAQGECEEECDRVGENVATVFREAISGFWSGSGEDCACRQGITKVLAISKISYEMRMKKSCLARHGNFLFHRLDRSGFSQQS